MPKLKEGTIWPTEEEDKKITAAAMADEDAQPFTDEQWEKAKPTVKMGRPKAEETKERISIRLSADVVEHFRSTGKGWQTRIDEALREYVSSSR